MSHLLFEKSLIVNVRSRARVAARRSRGVVVAFAIWREARANNARCCMKDFIRSESRTDRTRKCCAITAGNYSLHPPRNEQCTLFLLFFLLSLNLERVGKTNE